MAALNLENLVRFISNQFAGFVPKTIVEIGARDCEETLALHGFYPKAKILSFECNPEKLPECRNKVKGISEITLIEKAVSDKSGKITFYQIDTSKTVTQWEDGNPGASSLLKATDNYTIEKYVQKETEVDCTTLNEELPKQGVEQIDLLWMDIQGSELNALKGMKDKLANVRVIHTEVEFMEIYRDQPLFWEIKAFLNSQGFLLATFTSFHKNVSGDAVFVNMKTPGINLATQIKYWFTNKAAHLLYHYNILA